MRFRALDAAFGRLERRTIAFSPGLNIIEAPNESGKSTLAAALRVMLYGIAPRERGAAADKNRYAPWSGQPMRGALELESETFGDVTLRRETPRAGEAMARFSATRTGTGDEIPGLASSDCGEQLLGVPREVYERSAFIRQSGLAIDANAELERRIAALVTTGEESVSYTEASDALRKQLNARRSRANTGRIPILERELDADLDALEQIARLSDEKRGAEEELAALKSEEAALRAKLSRHELADRQERFAARERARRAAEDAEREASVFRRMLAEIPSREVLENGRARLCELEAAERERHAAEGERSDAELALSQFDARPKPPALRPAAMPYLLLALFCAAAAAAAFVGWLPAPFYVPYGTAAVGVLFACLFTAECLRARERRDAQERGRDALVEALDAAEDACRARKDEYDRALSELYETIPVGDAISAAAYIHENLARCDLLAQMEAEASRLRQQFDSLAPPDLKDVPAVPAERPAQSREALEEALSDVCRRLAEAQSRADYTAGRLRSLGDADVLRGRVSGRQAELARAREEYDALALAAETLEHANNALQTRFSPELGRRAGEYFRVLTGGRHDTVLLDRAFRALFGEAGGAAHEAALLSQGAFDQLYLAVRLAICDMVLPADRHVPYVLDDALVSFDDERCRAALELLCRIARDRQVLLLTCHSREAAMLAGQPNVTVTSL
ncbi:MAG: AAA family ATPase [Oscillospiraceae bacterium]|nr:AAA family ATPase [Oscillospiraceae bacterium]